MFSTGRPSTGLRDPFVWPALVAETVAWSLALYGLSGFVEFLADPYPRYFDYLPLVAAGIGVGLACLVFFLLGLRLLLSRSSRSLFIFSECVLLLVPGLLWLGLETTSKVNLRFDRSVAVELRPLVTERSIQTRNHRGSTSTSHHLRLNTGSDSRAAALLPQDLSVSPELYRHAEVGRPLLIRMRKGALGFEWVESVATAP